MMKTARWTALTTHRHETLEAVRTVLSELWQRFNDRRLIGLASESAFWVFLSLIPLAAVSGMLAARFALSNGVALGLLSRSLPHEAQELLATELTKVASYNGGRIGVVASATLLWLASSGVHAIFDAFEAATRCPARSWTAKRLLSIATCVALAIGMAAIALLVGHLESFSQVIEGRAPSAMGPTEALIRLTLGALVDLALTAFLFRVGAGRRTKGRAVLPGACLAVVLQIGLGAGYAVFIREIGDGSKYLAGLAVFGVTMTAVFIYMLSLLLGLTLNSVLTEQRAGAARTRLFGRREGA